MQQGPQSNFIGWKSMISWREILQNNFDLFSQNYIIMTNIFWSNR